MMLKASRALGERLDYAKWEVLRNDRKNYTKLTKVKGIANSNDSILMQGLYMDDRVSVTIPLCDRNSVLWSIKIFSSAWKGYVRSFSVRRSSPKGIVVSETSSGKNTKRKVAPTRQISRRDKS
ncbi:hypothetical protein GW17_00055201 [Ensete ventricosum]|nr:hypothetical protein GW17_00055201 [Ensete ventricosum]